VEDSPLSVKVEPTLIGEHLAGREFVYLITNNGERSHVVALRPEMLNDIARFANTGRTPLANVAANSSVTLTWPPCDSTQTHEHAKYSVVADGTSRLDGDVIEVTITNAVLHRPA
jgi:hypothetical protein